MTEKFSFSKSVAAFGILLAVSLLLPVMGWAHGEVEGGGEQKAQRIVDSPNGKYRIEVMVSPSIPTAGEPTNMEFTIVRLLPKPDPLLGSEVPLSAMPRVSVLQEGSQKVSDASLSVHSEGEAGVFGVDDYHFRDSGSLMLRLGIPTDSGQQLAVDFPVSVKTNVAGLFRLWVNIAIAVLIAGLTATQLWKIRARGGRAGEMARPAAIGVVSWVVVAAVMNVFVINKVIALRKVEMATAAPQSVTNNVDGSYTIPASIQKQLGIVLVDAKEIPVEQALSAYGSVQARPDRIAEVFAPLWGRIEFSKEPLKVGDKVTKGQELVRVILELSQVERQPLEAKGDDIHGSFDKAKKRLDAAQIEYDRAKKLAAANPAFEQDAKWAKELYDDASDAYELISKEDRNYAAVVKFRDPRRTPVNSPLAGTITSIDFVPGQLDQNGEYKKLFTIVDTTAVWVKADVFLNDVVKLKAGEEVLVHPAARPQHALKGTIHWIGDTVDAVNRTVPVIVDVANPDQELALGAFVRVEFPRYRQKAVAVPEQAVMDDGVSKRVYMAVGPEKFQSQPVEVGIRKDGWVQVISGLQPGDQVITKGAALLGAVPQPENTPSSEQGPQPTAQMQPGP